MNMKKIIAIFGIALLAIVSVGAVCADESLENVGCGLTPSVSEHTYEHGILTIPINNHVVDSGSVSEVIGAWSYKPCPEPTLEVASGSETHYDPSPDHGDDHSDSVSKNVPGKNPNVGKQIVSYFHNGDFPKSFNVDDWNGYTASAEDTTSIEFGDDGFNWVPLYAYSDDSGVNYRDEINQSFGGITVDDWVVPSHEPNYEFNFYKNGIRGDFIGNYADGNGGAIYYTNGLTGSLSDGNGNLLTVDQSGFVVPGSELNPPRPDINKPYYPTDVTEI